MSGIPRTLLDLRREAARAGMRPSRDRKRRANIHAQPARWAYATRPLFRRIREPLVDVFKEATEVQIIIDLGGFKREEIRFGRNGDNYEVVCLKEGQKFMEELALPPGVDLSLMRESLRNGILQITLPKKKREAS